MALSRAPAPANLRELGIGFVPSSPLGRGFLIGRLRTPDDFTEAEYRRSAPRF